MEISKIKKTHSNKEEKKFQDSVEYYLNQINAPFLRGVEITATLTTSAQNISHKLGRKPRGWFVISINANSNVYSTASDDRFLSLTASATCTVKLWVF